MIGFAFFASMTTVTFNSRQLKLTPDYLHQITDLDSGTILREIQEKVSETAEYVWDVSGAEFLGDYEYDNKPTISSRKRKGRHEALVELTRPNEATTCPSGMVPVEMVSNPEADASVGRRIPKIVHMTGKTKCLTGPFYEAAKMWHFEGHSFYFHDDEAMEELFNRDWPMFPQLKNTIICLKGAGGGKMIQDFFIELHDTEVVLTNPFV